MDKIKILTGKNQYLPKKRGGYRQYIHSLTLMRYGQAPDWELCDETSLPPSSPGVKAWINQGSWAANCECGGSLIVEPGEPYFCPDCCNAAQGGKARPVIWPEDKAGIELVLEERPFSRNRNWLPHETLENLVDENIAHGDPLPAEALAKVIARRPKVDEPGGETISPRLAPQGLADAAGSRSALGELP